MSRFWRCQVPAIGFAGGTIAAVLRAALLLLLGCGRVGFEGTGSTDVIDAEDGTVLPDDAGQVPGTVQVTVSSTGQCPMVAWSGSSIGVVWKEPVGSATADVVFARYDLAGTLVQGPLTLATGLENVGCSAIAWAGDEFLIAVPHGALNRLDIDTVRVSDTGASAWTNAVSNSGDSERPKLAVRGTQVLLVWLDQQGGSYNVLGVPLSLDGVPTAPELAISGVSSSNGAPSVVVTGTGFAVTYNAGALVTLRELGPDGALAGPERSLPGSDANNEVAAVDAGSELMLAWAGFSSNVITTATVARATGTAVSGPSTFPVFNNARSYAMVARPGGAALAFIGSSTGTIKLNLALLDAGGQLVSTHVVRGASTQSVPSLAFTGTHFITGVGASVSILPAP